MTKQIKWLVIGFVVVAGLFFLSQLRQDNLSTDTRPLFSFSKEDIYGIKIQKEKDTLSLYFNSVNWRIEGHDSLEVREGTLNAFFDKILTVKMSSPVSQNPNRWDKYNVGDSTGTTLTFLDIQNQELTTIIVGQSGAGWATSNVRIPDNNNVYQTSENIVYSLSINPKYWGNIPPPPEPDSTSTDSL